MGQWFSVSVSSAGASGKDSKVRVRSALDRFGLPGMELAASSEPGRSGARAGTG